MLNRLLTDHALRSALTRRGVVNSAIAGSFFGTRNTGRLVSVQAIGEIIEGKRSTPEVGVAYSLWHRSKIWNDVWGTPQLGYYTSDDPAVIEMHARWIVRAGINFIYIDWSNTLSENSDNEFIEWCTEKLYTLYAEFTERPRICVMIGDPGDYSATLDGRLSAKADRIFSLLNSTERHRALYQTYLGRPLLIVYVGTPAMPQNDPPKWSDSRFTVRFMTGFLTEQPGLLGPGLISSHGLWSWEDRGAATYAMYRGVPENMTVVAAWRSAPEVMAQGRNGGATFVRSWERARSIAPRIVLAGTFNEWLRAEQPSAEISKDIEPSREFGSIYLEIVKQQATLLRQG